MRKRVIVQIGSDIANKLLESGCVRDIGEETNREISKSWANDDDPLVRAFSKLHHPDLEIVDEKQLLNIFQEHNLEPVIQNF